MDQHIRKVIILVLNWNGWRDTLDCLESLYRTIYPDYQVVFIDNNSKDDSLDKVRQWANGKMPYILYDKRTAEQGGDVEKEEDLHRDLPETIPHPLIIIETGDNLGFARGNNVGLRYARQRGAEYILLLNNDAMLRSPQSIATMVEFMETHPDAGACGGRLFYPDGTAQASYGNFPSLSRALAFLFPVYKLLPARLLRNAKRANVVPDGSQREPLAVDYPSGACFLVRNRAIDDIGLLDERFFMYAEETDWCLRMMKRGWRRYYLPQAEVTHKLAGSFSDGTPKMNRYFLDSLFKYYRKNFTPWRLWIVAAGYAVRSLYSVLHWTIAALIIPEPRRSLALDRARHWDHSLKLALVTMKDLLTGKISNDQQLCQARDVT